VGHLDEPNLGGFFQGSEDDFVDASSSRPPRHRAPPTRREDLRSRARRPDRLLAVEWRTRAPACSAPASRNGWERDLGELLDRVGSHLDVVTHTHLPVGRGRGHEGRARRILHRRHPAAQDSIRHVIDSHGGADKEFWLTETGWEQPPQGSTSESDVAARIVDLYAKQAEVCAGTYAASAVDPCGTGRDTYYFHFPTTRIRVGHRHTPTEPRPAYTALQGWARDGRPPRAPGRAGPS
jgi:hypothetical protein